MAVVRKRQLDLLAPYIADERPTPGKNGRELNLHCPIHDDGKRSAQLNIDTGEWYCQACARGGSIGQLLRMQDEWVAPPQNGRVVYGNDDDSLEVITEGQIRGWHSSLIASGHELDELMEQRGLEQETIEAYEIGYDHSRRVYTIPIRSAEGELWNVRRYNMNPPDDRRKIWGVKGSNAPRLFPIAVLEEEPEEIIICEGEWDALLTIQNGFAAITRTAAADVWNTDWNEYFAGRTVYLAHDADSKGELANRKLADLLMRVADVRIVVLPYPLAEKHGKDLTDYWLEGHNESDFRDLLELAVPADGVERIQELQPSDASVLDTFDARRVGDPLRVTVTIKGRREPGYSIPKEARLVCTRDAGAKCNVCPLNGVGGDDSITIRDADPVVLELIDSTKLQAHEILRRAYGAVKCNRLTVDITEYQAVEVLYARPSVEHVNGRSEHYKNMKITSIGKHDTMANNTVQVVGALQPDPRTHTNEFLAWDVSKMASSLDNFKLDAAAIKLMRRFRPRAGQTPLDRLQQIADDLSAHVTKIYGRPEMHMAMDLVFHSAISFTFGGQHVERGWLELIVVGDSRTGKSEAATGLVRHYRAGEIVLGENASYAGLVGGLQQYGSGKEWAVNWGVLALNDRRLVVLDEISGLPTDDIARMSDVRSRGVAQINKIQQEATLARTRLIWTGNPRGGSMAQFTYGVQALAPLIGNPEDIARFDIAMSVKMGEVDSAEINRQHADSPQKFSTKACQVLLRWAWSRTAEQITWAPGAEDAVYAAAQELGSRYVEDPPLIQVANVRIKVARVAVALAMRLFSTDETYEQVVVKRSHVRAAVAFINMLYTMPGFGYFEFSKELIEDRQNARAKSDDVLKWLRGRPGLAKFLRTSSSFKRQDLEEILNETREGANGVINYLYDARMVKKDKGNVKVEPALHELLRKVKE